MENDLVKYYRELSEKNFNEVCRYAEFMGGLSAILNFDNRTPAEKIEMATKLVKEFKAAKLVY